MYMHWPPRLPAVPRSSAHTIQCNPGCHLSGTVRWFGRTTQCAGLDVQEAYTGSKLQQEAPCERAFSKIIALCLSMPQPPLLQS